MSECGKLIILSGPSGVGKSTVVAKAMKLRDDLCFSVSVTTRKPRPGEVDGKDYFFISKEQFDQMAENNELLEYATEELANIEGTRFIGQAPKRNGLISFVIDGIHPYDLGTIIDKMGVAVRTGHHCAEPVMTFFDIPGTVRASFAMYNTKEEIDIFVKAVEKAANMLK